jgi:hypothetical protein
MSIVATRGTVSRNSSSFTSNFLFLFPEPLYPLQTLVLERLIKPGNSGKREISFPVRLLRFPLISQAGEMGNQRKPVENSV